MKEERKEESKKGRTARASAQSEYNVMPVEVDEHRQKDRQTDRQAHTSDNLITLPYRLPHTNISYI